MVSSIIPAEDGGGCRKTGCGGRRDFLPSQSKIKDFCQLSHRGSEPSAASGRKSEVSEWQRSKKSRKSVSPKIFSGTATGEPWALPRQWNCVEREALKAGGGTPPLREDGGLSGFAEEWCGDGRLCCTPHQSKIKDFCQLSHRESQGRCRAGGRFSGRGGVPYGEDGWCGAGRRMLGKTEI